jgi:beta-N-acetylhexosaminidase
VTIDAVVSAVEQGRLDRQRISESVERIMAAKTRLGLIDQNVRKTSPVDYREHLRIARELGHKAPGILAGDKKLLPLDRAEGVACFIVDDDNEGSSGNAFIRTMKERFPYLSVLVLTPDSDMPESLARDSISAAESVVMAIYSKISASKGHSGLTDSLRDRALHILHLARKAKRKSVVVSFDSPYLLELFKNADMRIAAYDRMEEIQQAVAGLLAGE